MRYEKGTIQISPARDIPLLQQVLRSGFATSDQLYEFMQLNQSERSRQAFDHRLRRLLAHGLIEKHQGAARGRPQVFVISKEGASLLIDVGELFAGRIGMETGERSCAHWLDLNDLHLALARNKLLMRWTPASEICSQNDLTQFRYAKDYDAVVAVECGGREIRFGIEYERTPKTYETYRRIASKLGGETLVDTVLYLVPNYHLLCMIRDSVAPKRVQVCVALFAEFMDRLLATPVMIAGTGHRDIPFQTILMQACDARGRQ
jgi:hypothetical protein